MASEEKFNYRQWLVEADHDASQAYDKTLLTLAAGALGISFAFIKDLVSHPKPETTNLLLWGWSGFGLSLLATLVSMLTSQLVLRLALHQYDQKRLDKERPGGGWTIATWSLTILGGAAFVAGVILLILFARGNLGEVGKP